MGRDRLILLAAVALSVPALAWATVRITNDDGPPSTVAAAGAEPGVSHVHGLGINPADGSLYIATHHGTFRMAGDGDAPERVGRSYQDTMGFTVTGPDEFLGSGHPDYAAIQKGAPQLLGLIESRDGGGHWEPLSLSGEADFHALAYAHGQVYGWESTSGRFMVTKDRRDWEERSVRELGGFVVDPADEDHVVAVTAHEGVLDSSDGGRTWAVLPGAPFTVLSWDARGGLYGATPGGNLHRSVDDGASWEQVGTVPGTPQALLVEGDTLYMAVFDADDTTEIHRSTDAGATWQRLYRDA